MGAVGGKGCINPACVCSLRTLRNALDARCGWHRLFVPRIRREISHYCPACKQLACIHCGHDNHIAAGHSIVPVAAAGAEAATALAAALPRCLAPRLEPCA